MKSVKFFAFAAALAAAVTAAVAAVGAGDGSVLRTSRRGGAVEPGSWLRVSHGGGTREQSAQSEPRSQGRVMVLEGWGSRLGVTVSDLDAAGTKAAPQGGVRIEEVAAGSPAEKAGLKAGDIVVEFDGERVRSARQFTRLVQETPEGRTVAMAVVRDGQRQTLQATPEARAFSWRFDVDGDRIRREVERSLRDFQLDMPSFSFRWDEAARGRGGRLGVSVEGLTPQLAEYFGARDGGVLVLSVSENSPAARAGLRAGDVITAIDGTRVRDARTLARAVAAARGEITIGLLRDRKELTLKATLDPRSDARTPLRRRVVPAAMTGRRA